MKLNKSTIERIVYEGANNTKHIVWDETLPGFGCRIYPSGKKAFVFSYRYLGQKHMMVLGRYGVLTVDQARKKAKSLSVGVSDGVDPLQVKREEMHGNTVGNLSTYFLEQHAKRRKKSWQEDQRRCNRHIIPVLGMHLIKTVTRADVAALHRRIGMKSPYEANRVLALLSVMFEFAIKQGFREEAAGNPAKRIDKYPERKRDRWVTFAALPRRTGRNSSSNLSRLTSLTWTRLFPARNSRARSPVNIFTAAYTGAARRRQDSDGGSRC